MYDLYLLKKTARFRETEMSVHVLFSVIDLCISSLVWLTTETTLQCMNENTLWGSMKEVSLFIACVLCG